MATIIKQIKVYNGSAWQTADIGVDASNITLSSNIAGSTNLQTALSNILPASQLAASKIVLTDSNKKLTTSTVSTTELEYLSGTTASIQTQLNGKVAKTGDTMTGSLTISKTSEPVYYAKNTSYSAKNGTTNPPSTVVMGKYSSMDKDGNSCGWMTTYKNSSGVVTTQFATRCYNSSNEMIMNTLSLGIDNNGSRTVSVSNPTQWRNAIGAQASGNYTTFNNSRFSATSISANYDSNQEIQLAVTSKTSGKNRIFIMGDNGISMYNSSTSTGVWNLPISQVVLNNVARYTTTSLLTGSKYATVGDVNFYLIGKRICFATFRLTWKADMTAGTSYTIATVANAALRPPTYVTSHTSLGDFTMQEGGSILLKPSQNLTSATGNMYLDFMYITKANYPS